MLLQPNFTSSVCFNVAQTWIKHTFNISFFGWNWQTKAIRPYKRQRTHWTIHTMQRFFSGLHPNFICTINDTPGLSHTTWDFQQCAMCNLQRLRSACAYAQSDQSFCLLLEYSMSVKLLTVSKCHMVGNLAPWLNYFSGSKIQPL